jgi:hypothetical protein
LVKSIFVGNWVSEIKSVVSIFNALFVTESRISKEPIGNMEGKRPQGIAISDSIRFAPETAFVLEMSEFVLHLPQLDYPSVRSFGSLGSPFIKVYISYLDS